MKTEQKTLKWYMMAVLIGVLLACSEEENQIELFVQYSASCKVPCNISWLESGKLVTGISSDSGYGVNAYFSANPGDSVYIRIESSKDIPADPPPDTVNGVLIRGPQLDLLVKAARITLKRGDSFEDFAQKSTEDYVLEIGGVIK